MTNHNQEPLNESIMLAITSSEIPDALVDIAEIGVDEFLDEGIIKDIPVVGTIYKLAKAGISIKDRFFIRKVGRFLVALHEINTGDKQAFQDGIKNDPEMAKKVGENLIIILDRLDDLDKPSILAKLFNAYIEKKIDFSTFRRLASAVERAYIDDLKDIIEEKTELLKQNLIKEQLINSGLAKIDPSANVTKNSGSSRGFPAAPAVPTSFFNREVETIGQARINFVLSELGQLYVKIMTDKL